MSNNNLAGFPMLGPRVDTAITYHPLIVTLETPIELPVTEPETAQVQYTVATAELPTASPYPLPAAVGEALGLTYQYFIYAYVQNASGATRTVYAKSKTANTPTWSSASSASVTNAYFASFMTRGLTTVAIGDTQEIKLYASGAGVSLIKYMVCAYPNYLGTALIGKPLLDVAVDLSTASVFSAGITSTGDYRYQTVSWAALSGTTSMSLASWLPNTVYGIGYLAAPSNAWITTASDNLRHYQPAYPTRIAYTPIL